MSHLEVILAQQEQELFRRGQEEILKLQQDKQQAVSSMRELQMRQEALMEEHSDMHRALLDITSKLEFVATEMREAFRSSTAPSGQVPYQPTLYPSGASFEFPEVSAESMPGGFDYLMESGSSLGMQNSLPPFLSSLPPGISGSDSCAAAVTAAMLAASQAAAAAAAAAAAVGLSPESAAEGPRTPPRSVRGMQLDPGFSGQHAVQRLSLASALMEPAHMGLTPPPPGPPPGQPSRLSIAACLDAEVFKHAAPAPQNAISPANSDSSFAELLAAAQAWNGEEVGTWSMMNSAMATAKAQSAQLRAEAPAFVPGAF
ncbi:unnamed protein product [Polarella glacialis]|uniref:Uncharacterized protein n=1 Tax=Polarella glacialis TaxID=89957 RepID=A0A813IGH1_POLGL|nr:unnamed protein product [Polarella glacialis]